MSETKISTVTEFFAEISKALAKGSEKNNRGDWRDRDDGGVYDRLSAIDRHLDKYCQTKEPHHLIAIGANAFIVLWHHKNKNWRPQ